MPDEPKTGLAMVRTLEQQQAPDAGKLAEEDLALFDRPASITARRGEANAPDHKDTSATPSPEPAVDAPTPILPARADVAAPSPADPVTPIPTPAAPAEPPAGPARKWAGRFDTPEGLEAHVLAQERYISELGEGQKRLERILAERLAAPTEPVPTREPAVPAVPASVAISARDVKAAAKTVAELSARMSLGDEISDEDIVRYAQANRDLLLVHAKLADELVPPTQAAVETSWRAKQDEERKQAEVVRRQQAQADAFEQHVFTQHPVLKAVSRPILGRVAEEARQELMRTRPELTDSARTTDEQWTAALSDAIWTKAQATLRLEPAGTAAPTGVPAVPGSPSAVSPVPASAARTVSGARSEGPGGLTPAPRSLTGQDNEIDALFKAGLLDPV